MKEGLLRIMAAGVNTDDINIPCAGDTCADPTGGAIVSGVLGWVYMAIVVVAVIIIIIAGIQYLTSQGEPEKAKRAQASITYTIIGLIIALSAATIIGFVTGAFA